MAEFTKKILAPGTYTVPRKDGTTSRVYIGPQRLKRWVANFKTMGTRGLRIPAPWRHDEKAEPLRLDGDDQDTDAFRNAGWWRDLWVGEDGALYGKLDVPRNEDVSRVGQTVVDVSPLAKSRWLDGAGGEYEDALTHIALVTHPVVPSQTNFRPVSHAASSDQSIAIALSYQNFLGQGDLRLAADADFYTPDPEEDVDPAKVRASGATLDDALPVLRELGLTLPADTTPENFVERVIVAALAIKGRKDQSDDDDGDVNTPPGKSKEQPAPVAMSQQTQTKQPETLKLSAEDQAKIDWATKQASAAYKRRIEDCVKQGKITPKLAQDQGAPLLETLQLSFDAKGELVKGPVDLIIDAWEAIPAGSVLHGQTPATVKKTKTSGLFGGAVAFSLEAGVKEEIPPEDDLAPMSDEEINDVLHKQFSAAGRTELARSVKPQ